MSMESHDAELSALRQLETAVRACGLPTMMVSGQRQLDMLAAALKAVNESRKRAVGEAPAGQSPLFHQEPSRPVM